MTSMAAERIQRLEAIETDDNAPQWIKLKRGEGAPGSHADDPHITRNHTCHTLAAMVDSGSCERS